MESSEKSMVQWTKEQQKVIDIRDCNVLVSAAAGSGKTAVLVERIVQRITEGTNPMDIDKLLVVTFTNAAAAEMRERIREAIEKKLVEDPDNLHLQKQATLIHSALITTIHSFCLYVIRNYFHTIDLDPSFRVADETELKLLRADTLEKVLEEQYERETDEFHQLVECYATGKSDIAIEEMILQLYSFSMSYPWPEEWLLEQKKSFQIEHKEQLEEAFWMEHLCIHVKRMLESAKQKNLEAIAICNYPDGPKAYEDALLADQEILDACIHAAGYLQWETIFSTIKWSALSRKKQPDASEEKKERVKSIRNDIKKIMEDIRKQFFYQSSEEMINDLKHVRIPMETLIEVTLEFMSVFQEMKEEKKILDFNDMEHLALKILVERKEDNIKPTVAAEELSHHFEEILIDEYQDSNLVQESILNSISKEKYGSPNIFMVGDVKQSIYKFRLARPELFMKKYHTYTMDTGKYQRIDLHKNFRSRAIVLDSVNYIFQRIMKEELGKVAYDDNAALYVGATFLKAENEQISENTELLLITDERKENEKEQSLDEELYTQRELEAKAIGTRIKELTDPVYGLSVIDKETKQYRICRRKDIVILLRTMSGWAEVFVETLMKEGILAYSDTQSGYFSALEVKTILNYLKILDNPRQDIPLAAVMRSPIGAFTSEEMALIRIENKEMEWYEAVMAYAQNDNTNIPLQGKVRLFLEQLNQIRETLSYTPIHTVLKMVYEETGYYDYVTVMPGGERRKRNLDMLIEKAVEYENTSYSGLFAFSRYIEKLHKYEVDYGEAAEEGAENAVRIMSIHKSKGLEFPVVIVAGMGKPFNTQDTKSRLVVHAEYGIGPDCVLPEERVKTPTIVKKAIQRQMVLENLGEELRVLYVALTRAKEKLIMTGYVKKLQEQMKKWIQSGENEMDYVTLSQAGNYLDWVVPVLQKENSLFVKKELHLEDLVTQETFQQLSVDLKKQILLQWDCEATYDAALREALDEQMHFIYPYLAEQNLKSKMTVSELKRLSYLEEEQAGIILVSEEERIKEEQVAQQKEEELPQVDSPLPKFLQQEETIRSVDLGSLYHKALEQIRIEMVYSLDDVKKEINRLILEEKIKEKEAEYLNVYKLYQFYNSDIGNRMKEAKKKGDVYQEQPFVLGIPANEINPAFESEEIILVQGIIDAYFEEDGEWVLVDYKTDRVAKSNGADILKKRYHSQLSYYERALEQLTSRNVKEKLIYSIYLEEAIQVE